MSIRTTHTVNREEALAIIEDKTGRVWHPMSNEFLGNKLDAIVNNCFYNFIVVDTPDEDIRTMHTINRYTVPDECE